jgi:hypothetical protein
MGLCEMPAQDNIHSVWWQEPDGVQRVGKSDNSLDPERMPPQGVTEGGAQPMAVVGQQTTLPLG